MQGKEIINLLKSTSGYFATGLFVSAVASNLIAKPASAVGLTSLLAGGSITSTGIVFSNFTFTSAALNGAVPVSSDSVTVNAITDGIDFVFPLAAGPNQVNDLAWGYKATALSGTLSGLVLTTTGATTGTTSVGTVGETIFNAGPTVAGSVDVSTTPSILIGFTPSTSVTVQKDVNVVGGTAGTASISIVDQTFIPGGTNPNIPVPEPSEVMGTLGLGVLSAGYLLKRQLKKASV